jgi:hypothetical protein
LAEAPGAAASIILPSKKGNKLVESADNAIKIKLSANLVRYGRKYENYTSASLSVSLFILALGASSPTLPLLL